VRRIDAHHHLWDTETRDYPWMDGPWADPLRGMFGVDEFDRASADHDVAASVVVQAVMEVDETRDLLALAADTPRIAGVVGWVDLTGHDVGDRLSALHAGTAGGKLVGIRHQVEDEPDPRWLMRDDVLRGLGAVGAAGLAYDLLVKPPQLAAAIEVVRRRPEVRFVLDHLGKPPIGRDLDDWSASLAALADQPNVVAKLSGLVTEADWRGWTVDQLRPCIDHALAVFGPQRLMFGSDWPVCTLAATYGEVVGVVDEALATLSSAEREAVLVTTAVETYGLAGVV
jgi:L-fuconolactonase